MDNGIHQLIKDLRGLKIREDGRRIWRPFMEKYDCQVICEIGVDEGINFELMIEHSPQLAIAVDSYINDGNLSRNESSEPQETLDTRYKRFLKKVADKSFVKICREYSFNAVKHFPNEYFDLVYMDSDQSYEGCLKDLEDWYPKVKGGRFLLGDGYMEKISTSGVKYEVKKAVNQFALSNYLQFHELPDTGWAIIRK